MINHWYFSGWADHEIPKKEDEKSRELMNVEDEEGLVVIRTDSGAAGTVGPKKAGQGFPITPTRETMMGI